LSQVRFYMQRMVSAGWFSDWSHQRLPQAAGGASHFAGSSGVYATNEAIKKNRSLIDGRWDKNDTKDSANVADLVAQGKCHYYDLPDQRLRDLRSLLLLRKRLKKQVTVAGADRNNLVAQYFPNWTYSGTTPRRRTWPSCAVSGSSRIRNDL